MILTPYLLFLFSVIVAAFVVLSARKRREEPIHRVVLCPETRKPASVEVDAHTIVNFFRDRRESRLKNCSRWPERADCAEECLAQIEPQLKVDAILAKWYDGKNCVTCSMPLVRADWQRGQAAALDQTGKFVPLRNMDWTQFPMVLNQYEPLCRKCHDGRAVLHRAATA